MMILRGEAAHRYVAAQTAHRLSPDGMVHPDLSQRVRDILARVQREGDRALRELGREFGDTVPQTPALSEEHVRAARERVSPEIQSLLQRAAESIRAYGTAIMNLIQSIRLERTGFAVGLDFRPVETVGCYVPGGRFPLPSTALMTAVTAAVAGVRDIAIVSPRLTDEVVFAGSLAGVSRFYQVGGAQAVAALAFGTETIGAVDMIVGPGNAFVTEAKRQVQGIVGIDLLAGPSEIAVIADGEANPRWVALDLLAQLEHDPQARATLLTDDEVLAANVADELTALDPSATSSGDHDRPAGDPALLVFSDLTDCVAAADRLAPEHLQLHLADPAALHPQPRHYGALFIGPEATVPFGDYMAGPNHTLPTGGTARFTGALTPLTFLRAQTWLQVDGEVQELAEDTEAFASLEGLTGHAAAARARLAGERSAPDRFS